MVKPKEWTQMLERRLLELHKQSSGYKKIFKLLKVSRSTVGSIICKFRATRTVATRHGLVRKKKASAAATTFMRRQVDKNTKITSKDLKEDLAIVGTDV